jgi:hypothetical protein
MVSTSTSVGHVPYYFNPFRCSAVRVRTCGAERSADADAGGCRNRMNADCRLPIGDAHYKIGTQLDNDNMNDWIHTYIYLVPTYCL